MIDEIRKSDFAFRIQIDPIRVLSQPMRCAVQLSNRLVYGLPFPSGPIERKIARVWKGTVLVGEDDDVLPEDDENIAELAIACPVGIRIAPQREKSSLAQSR